MKCSAPCCLTLRLHVFRRHLFKLFIAVFGLGLLFRDSVTVKLEPSSSAWRGASADRFSANSRSGFWRKVQTHHGCVLGLGLGLGNLLLVQRLHHHLLLLLLLLEQGLLLLLLLLKLKGLLHRLLVLATRAEVYSQHSLFILLLFCLIPSDFCDATLRVSDVPGGIGVAVHLCVVAALLVVVAAAAAVGGGDAVAAAVDAGRPAVAAAGLGAADCWAEPGWKAVRSQELELPGQNLF